MIISDVTSTGFMPSCVNFRRTCANLNGNRYIFLELRSCVPIIKYNFDESSFIILYWNDSRSRSFATWTIPNEIENRHRTVSFVLKYIFKDNLHAVISFPMSSGEGTAHCPANYNRATFPGKKTILLLLFQCSGLAFSLPLLTIF